MDEPNEEETIDSLFMSDAEEEFDAEKESEVDIAEDSTIREGMMANAVDIVIPDTTAWNPDEIETDYLNRGTFAEVFPGLFDRVYNHVTYELWRMGMKKDLAEEVMNIATEKAMQNWDKYTQGTYALSWIKKIVTNTCFNLRRQMRTRENREILIGVDHATYFDTLGFSSESAEKKAVEQIALEELKSYFDALPIPFRDATKAVILEGMRTDEAAEYLGIPSATLLTRVHRGRARLRDMINKQRDKDKDI